MNIKRKNGRPRNIIINGQQYRNWTVISEGESSGRNVVYLCRCKCGTLRRISGHRLKTARSCGCIPSTLTHGMSKTKEFMVWSNMTARCHNPNHKDFKFYGERGIIVCQRWRDSFQAFIDDMGRRPADGMEIDRTNTDGNYEPENCRWILSSDNKRNMRNNRRITFRGVTMIATDWARKIKMDPDVLLDRLNKLGWTIEKALTTPTLTSKQCGSLVKK